MKILIIGGTYFLGKHFTDLAITQHEIYLLNRGTNPQNDPRITEFHMDRHDTKKLAEISNVHFDVIVDFCAYSENDIRLLFEHLNATFDQYIFISTCDVYRRNTMRYMDENSELENRNFGGEAGDYISGKVALEKELSDCCKKYNVCYTSIRPAFIYGPDNYAPREGIYFTWIKNAGQIIQPSDATGEFQMVYVDDVARAILAACQNPLACNRAYNLCNPQMLNYTSFANILKNATGVDFQEITLPITAILEKGIPLPFPLTHEESQYYTGTAVKELGICYTPIEKGMAETFQQFQ